MAEIKWMSPTLTGRGSKGNDTDIYITKTTKGFAIKFANEGFNAIAAESTYLEVSHPDSYELHFRQYNKKPNGRWSVVVTKKKISKCIKFTPNPSLVASFDKWAGKKYKVYKDVEHNTFYIKLEQGIKEEKK